MAALTHGAAFTLDETRALLKQNPPPILATAAAVLLRLLSNLASSPQNLKFRSIRVENPALQQKLFPCRGALELLGLAGFSSLCVDGVDELVCCGEVDCSFVAAQVAWLKGVLGEIEVRKEPSSVGISVEERQRRQEAARLAAAEKEKERRRVRAEWASDKDMRQAKQSHGPAHATPSRPSSSSEALSVAARAPSASSSGARPIAGPIDRPMCADCTLRVRLPDGGSWEGTFPSGAPLRAVFDRLRSAPLRASPAFSLKQLVPKREFFEELHGSAGLAGLGLCPAAALVAFPAAARGKMVRGSVEAALGNSHGDGIDLDGEPMRGKMCFKIESVLVVPHGRSQRSPLARSLLPQAWGTRTYSRWRSASERRKRRARATTGRRRRSCGSWRQQIWRGRPGARCASARGRPATRRGSSSAATYSTPAASGSGSKRAARAPFARQRSEIED